MLVEAPFVDSICLETSDQAHSLDASMLDAVTASRLAELFSALADPTRLRIIALLLDHEVCVHRLEQALGMTQSAISHQLRLLRHLHIVRARKAGRHVFYALDDDHVRLLFTQSLKHAAHSAAGVPTS